MKAAMVVALGRSQASFTASRRVMMMSAPEGTGTARSMAMRPAAVTTTPSRIHSASSAARITSPAGGHAFTGPQVVKADAHRPSSTFTAFARA
jgi:hypothetical protein